MTLATRLPPNVILGVTHLLVNGAIRLVLKCPFCNFASINENVVTHHIRYSDDAKHDICLEKLDKSSYPIVQKEKSKISYGPYLTKEEIKLPWISCLWCSYKDKIEFDLSLHFLECHKKQLLRIKITPFERRKALSHDRYAFLYSAMEYRLDKAVNIAKLKSGNKLQK